MEFEWDENKRQINIEKHGIDFVDALRIFDYDTVILEDNRFNYGEQRWIALGLLNGRIIVVVYTEINEIIRIISARKGTKNEQKIYFTELND